MSDAASGARHPRSGVVTADAPGTAGGDRPASRTTPAPIDAATVVVVRDHQQGMQVLLQERALASDFVGGAWVFPGGKVDPRDGAVGAEHLGRVDLGALHAVLGASSHDRTRALLVAAIRETFEEAGVLLATRADRPISAAELADPAFTAARAGLADRTVDHDWREFLAAQQVVLDLAALRPLAWWITPHGVHRRFSTRFFLAPVPVGQDRPAGHDDVEMTGTVWTTPADALAAAERGARSIILPTRRVLASLDGLGDVSAALEHADRGGFDLRPIIPVVRRGGSGMLVQHPDGGPAVAV